MKLLRCYCLGLVIVATFAVNQSRAQSLGFFSDTSWQVYTGDPAGPPGSFTLLGPAELVCLNALPGCPPGAVGYGYPDGLALWPTDISSIPQAEWIWAPGVTGATTPADSQQFFFSKTFNLPNPPSVLQVSVAADDSADVRVNGVVVGTAVEWFSLTTIDIGKYLVAGTDLITIRGQNSAGCGGPCPYSVNPAAVVFGTPGSGIAAPTKLQATQISPAGTQASPPPTQVLLTWNYGSNPADGFSIERKTISQSWDEATTLTIYWRLPVCPGLARPRVRHASIRTPAAR